MSLTQCQKHGLQGGPHCCVHVRNAISSKSEGIKYEEISCSIDEERSYIIDNLICLNCLNKYNLNNKKFIDEDILGNEDKFPYVCPICIECVKEYENLSKT